VLLGHQNILELERDLPSSLPLHPVSEKGVSIIDTNVVVLGEGKIIWQVLGEDELIPGFLQLSPWDPSLVPTCCDL
jgi:hypothetical protein